MTRKRNNATGTDKAGRGLGWANRALELVVVSIGLGLPFVAATARADDSLQQMIEKRLDRQAGHASVPTRLETPGHVVRGSTYEMALAGGAWRERVYQYRGTAVLDEKYLDFAHGEDDFVTLAFDTPSIAHGGRVSLVAIAEADPGDLVLRVSTDNADWKTIGRVDASGHTGVAIEPIDADRLYLMLDGREGNGLVLSQMVVAFFDARPSSPTQSARSGRAEAADEVAPATGD